MNQQKLTKEYVIQKLKVSPRKENAPLYFGNFSSGLFYSLGARIYNSLKIDVSSIFFKAILTSKYGVKSEYNDLLVGYHLGINSRTSSIVFNNIVFGDDIVEVEIFIKKVVFFDGTVMEFEDSDNNNKKYNTFNFIDNFYHTGTNILSHLFLFVYLGFMFFLCSLIPLIFVAVANATDNPILYLSLIFTVPFAFWLFIGCWKSIKDETRFM